MKIRGNTVVTPQPNPDWNQTDPTKADYIRNKPDIYRIGDNGNWWIGDTDTGVPASGSGGATEVYRASYDVYSNTLIGEFADLKEAFDSGKIVMLACSTPVGNEWSFCCDGYETADYGAIGAECLVFHSCSTESIRTLYVCADGTIQEKFVNIGDIGAALDSINDSLDHIIEIQNSLIGGE
jgi:hypothetical protein